MTALSVTVGADVTDLRTKLALAQADVKAFSAETRNIAQEMRNTSDAARAQLLPQLEASAKAAADAKANVASLTAELRGNAQAANENSEAHSHVTSAMGANRMAFMELEHSARAMGDALAAGADPLRVLAMEAPRTAQALSNLGPGAMAALVSPAAAAVAAVAALTGGLVALAFRAANTEAALRLAREEMALIGQLNPASEKQYADAINDLGTSFGYSERQARAMITQLEALQGPERARISDLARLAASYAAATNTEPADAARELVKALREGPDAFEKFSSGISRISEQQKEFITRAGEGHNELGAIDAIIKVSTDNWGKYGQAVKKTADDVRDYNLLAGLVGDPRNIAIPAPNLDAPKAAQRAPIDDNANRVLEIERDTNKALEQRTSILAEIKVMEDAVAKADNPSAKASAEESLAALRMKLTQTHSAIETQSFEQEMTHLKEKAAAAAQGSAERIAVLRQEADVVRTYAGENSAEYRQAEVEIANAVRENQEKSRQEYNKTEASMQHLIDTSRRLAQAIEATMSGLNQDLVHGTERIDQFGREFTNMQTRLTATMRKNQQEVNTLLFQPYKQAFQGITSSFNQSLIGMINGTETFSQAMKNLAMGILDTFVEMGLQMVEHWAEQKLEELVIGKATDGTAAISQITTAAAVAAANAFAATAAIPYIGPELAPAAAAAAEAEVMAFTAQVALATGTPNVPADMPAMIHKGEIVVPRTFSDGLRSGDLTLGKAGNDNAGGSGGDRHEHHHFDFSGATFGPGLTQAKLEEMLVPAYKNVRRKLAAA